MVHSGEECPLDRSRLVFLAGSYGAGGLDLSVNYGPRCDVGFVYLTPAGATTPPAVLQWHRTGDQLELRIADRPRWQDLPRPIRECWESNLRHHVALFLGGRHSEVVGCPKDGTRSQALHRWRDGAGTGWLMAWCRWCRMAFLFAADPDYGWEHCADVAWDGRRRRYQLGKAYATGGGRAASPQVVEELPPLPRLLRSAEPAPEPDRPRG